jgi:hypothetical protein
MSSRTDIFDAIVNDMRANAALFALLGPATSENFRLYRSFPQIMSKLTSYEPGPTGEGWLVLQEAAPSAQNYDRQYATIYEVMALQFHIFATRYQIADDVAHLLDATWHWSVEQQREVQYGDWILLNTRRYAMNEVYTQGVKLHQKSASFWQTYVETEQRA